MHGTRGWNLLNEEEDKKILSRELIRLEISIKEGIKKYGENREILVCMHFPPTNKELLRESDFIKLMEKYNVKKCIYGHLHGEAMKDGIDNVTLSGIELNLVSADYLCFKLREI